MCLSVLQTSTPHELAAVADTHTEHNQLSHVHVHSCPADAQCYVTQFYQYTSDGYPQQRDCITSVYFQNYPIHLGK